MVFLLWGSQLPPNSLQASPFRGGGAKRRRGSCIACGGKALSGIKYIAETGMWVGNWTSATRHRFKTWR